MERIIGLLVFAVLLITPSMCTAAEQQKLPAGFIALSESHMPNEDAVAFCKQRGGRLPRINNSDSWDGKGENIPIDGFGYVHRPWSEVGLPVDHYWTSTGHSDHQGQSWFVGAFGGSDVVVNNFHQRSSSRVACVP